MFSTCRSSLDVRTYEPWRILEMSDKFSTCRKQGFVGSFLVVGRVFFNLSEHFSFISSHFVNLSLICRKVLVGNLSCRDIFYLSLISNYYTFRDERQIFYLSLACFCRDFLDCRTLFFKFVGTFQLFCKSLFKFVVNLSEGTWSYLSDICRVGIFSTCRSSLSTVYFVKKQHIMELRGTPPIIFVIVYFNIQQIGTNVDKLKL